jgi:small subunit ribosomal protein S20
LANIKSQIKRNRQNDRRRQRNRVYRGETRTAIKLANAAIAEGAPESRAALLKAISTLDKAAEKGVLHKNNVARRKSRMMKRFHAMKPAEELKVETPVEVEAKSVPAKKKAAAKKAPAKTTAPKKAEPKTTAAKKTEPKTTAAKKTETKKTTAKKPATPKKAAPKK